MEIYEPYGFIYITTNMVNGKRYIGQKKFETTTNWHSYIGSGVKLKKAILKYGKENFVKDIVDIAYSEEQLNQLEIEWINNYNCVKSKDFYNVSTGGKVGNTLAGKTEEEMIEFRRKCGEKNKGRISPNKGKHFKYKKRICNKPPWNKGIKNPYGCKEKHPMYGKKQAKETRDKIAKSQTGKNNNRSKKVICVTTNKIFDCIIDGCKFYNYKNPQQVSACCRGKAKSAGKHPITNEKLIWKYYKE